MQHEASYQPGLITSASAKLLIRTRRSTKQRHRARRLRLGSARLLTFVQASAEDACAASGERRAHISHPPARGPAADWILLCDGRVKHLLHKLTVLSNTRGSQVSSSSIQYMLEKGTV